MDTLSDNYLDIIGQLERIKKAGGTFVRWGYMNDPKAMASWTVPQYSDWLANRFFVFDQCSPWLLANGMPAILEVHHPVGGVKDGKWRLFHDESLMAWHLHFVEVTAAKYKDDHSVIALEIINEPFPKSDAQLWNFYRDAIIRIRAAGFHKHIVVGHKTAQADQIANLKVLPFPNIMYSVHLWPAWTLDPNSRERTITKSYVRELLAKAIKWEKNNKAHLQATNSSMFLGEYGCHFKSGKGKNFLPFCKAVASVATDLAWPSAWIQTSFYDHHAFRATDGELAAILGAQ